MKDLSIEEKAKRYDEAIERAKNFIENGDERERTIAESIFAGLMEESEDEKIRGEIIHFIKGIVISNVTEDQRRMWIDWLEKQGKIIDEYEDKLDRCACESFDKGYKVALEKQGEQNPAWSEEDEKILERLIKEKRYSYSTCEEDDDIKDHTRVHYKVSKIEYFS